MIKRDEVKRPDSCLNRAKDDELIFVLLGRDNAAPAAIREWVSRRLFVGKNTIHDQQILEALRCADAMENYRREKEAHD